MAHNQKEETTVSMHNETYLHDNIRVGGVKGLLDKLGNVIPDGWRTPAWWFNASKEAQRIANGDSPSHYATSIPLSVIRSELFGWSALDGVISITVDLHIPGDHPLSKTPGTEENRQVTFKVPEWKGVIREDKLIECYLQDRLDELGSETVLNVASAGFNTASFAKVLLDNTIEIVGGGDNVVCTGAGVLKWGKIGYIEVSIPETMHDPASGIEYRPNLLGSTSFDGSVGTRWDKTITNVVCDNTHQWALSQASDKTGSFKIKRTKNFVARMTDARQALGLLEQAGNEFLEVTHEWMKIPVSPKQFLKFLEVIVPVPELKVIEKDVVGLSEQGEQIVLKEQRVSTKGQTQALNKRDVMSKLYFEDSRVSPWTGTKLGVAQMVNTWAQHEQTMKGAKAHDGNVLQARVEGQLLRVMDHGPAGFAAQDERFLNALDKVLLDYDAEGVLIPVGSDKPVSKPSRSIKQTPGNN